MANITNAIRSIGTNRRLLVAGALALALVVSISTFAAEPTGSIQVAAYVERQGASTPDGDPLGDVDYIIEGPDDVVEASTTADDPESDKHDLKPGTYTITVTPPPGYALAPNSQQKATITLTGGQSQRAVFKFKEAPGQPAQQ